jgi:hypothetical protein
MNDTGETRGATIRSEHKGGIPALITWRRSVVPFDGFHRFVPKTKADRRLIHC